MQISERTKSLLKAKIKAYLVHLSLSLLIFFVILYILLKHWYPGPFFSAHGGWHGVKILFFVDMVLGPLLTLLIYNHYKKPREIIFDFSIIAIIQIASLIWGSMAIYSKKPAAVVFWEDRFYTVSMDYYQSKNISQQQLYEYSDERPPIIFAKRPVDIDAFNKMVVLTRDEKIPAFAQTALYEPVKPNLATILSFSSEYNKLLEENPGRFQTFIVSDAKDTNNVAGIHLMSKHENMLLLLTGEGDLAGYLIDDN